MTYTNLMVNLELGRPNTALLDIVGNLANRFGAVVTGVVACQPMHIVYGDGSYISEDLLEMDRVQIERDVAAAEAEFRHALQMRVHGLDWRAVLTSGSLSQAVACEARCADLFVTAVAADTLTQSTRHVVTGDILMQLGRPVLIVPAALRSVSLQRVVVAWKDTAESRRAVHDALPLLRLASQVLLVEVAPDDTLPDARRRLDDVARWLKRHGVGADCRTAPCSGSDVSQLVAITDGYDADVIVAGAYGHSRLLEWAFGGVTRDLILRGHRCSFVSH